MSEYTSADGKEYHVWFDSLEELKQQSEAMVDRVNRYKWELLLREHGHHDWNWSGQESLRHAMDKCEGTWPELAGWLRDRVDKLKRRVDLSAVESVKIATRRRKRSRQDYGDTLDIHRVWSGELDKAWERPTRRNVLIPSERYASIYIDLSMSCANPFMNSLWRAAEALCIVELLTMMGINTEIWCGDSGRNVWTCGPSSYWSGVRVKEYTQPLNDERLAVMASAAMLRGHGFKMMACGPWPISAVWGYPLQVGMVKPIRDRQESGERVFRIGNCLSEQEAVIDLERVVNILKGEKQEVA